jgi:hypothetical protein
MKKMQLTDAKILAGVRGIEPRSRVLETLILTVVLYPYDNRASISLFGGDFHH